jgi:hypothetical protein
VIYRSWRVNVVHSLCLLASWPREFVATIIEDATVEEVVIDTDEVTQSPWVIEPGEVSVGPTTIVFVAAGA